MFEEYRIGNRFVRATVTQPQGRIRTIAPVRSFVHIPLKYKVSAGEIILKDNEPYLLLAEHHSIRRVQILLGLLINCTITVINKTQQFHPVTKMPTKSIESQPIQIPAVRDIVNDDKEESLTFDKSVYFLGQEVTTESKIDGKTVRAVSKLNGIYRAEVY